MAKDLGTKCNEKTNNWYTWDGTDCKMCTIKSETSKKEDGVEDKVEDKVED